MCTAVGSPDSESPWIVHTTDGVHWKVQTAATAPNTSRDVLQSVACVSATRCYAVGYRQAASPPYTYSTLLESSTGDQWHYLPSPTTTSGNDDWLSGIACTSTTNCVAVGYAGHDSPSGAIFRTIGERWNGRRWTIEKTINVWPNGEDWFLGVACPTTATCIAVGHGRGPNATVDVPLIEHRTA